jgi:hypothetical protein
MHCGTASELMPSIAWMMQDDFTARDAGALKAGDAISRRCMTGVKPAGRR